MLLRYLVRDDGRADQATMDLMGHSDVILGSSVSRNRVGAVCRYKLGKGEITAFDWRLSERDISMNNETSWRSRCI